jgi:hypothetical protein
VADRGRRVAAGAVLEVAAPAVGGVPVVHRVPPELAVVATTGRQWAGSRVADDPIMISHQMGRVERSGLTPFARGPYPLNEYLLDERGAPAILSDAGGAPRQALRTRRPGYEYELTYEAVPERGWEWVWQRTLFMLALPARRRGLLVHASAFVLPDDGGVVVCPGASGVGKSTLAAQVASDFGDRAPVLSDERVIITLDEEGAGAPRVWGTPWHSTAALASALDGPLAAIVLPSRGDAPALTRLPPGEAVARLVGAFALPFWDDAATAWGLALVDRVVSSAPIWRFDYRPRPGAAAALVQALADSKTLSERGGW